MPCPPWVASRSIQAPPVQVFEAYRHVEKSVHQFPEVFTCVRSECGSRRSRGGLTTKIHSVPDASGLPVRFALSSGQAHDSTLAGALLDDHLPLDAFVLADKAYDAEWIRAMIEAQDAVPIIPNRSTTTGPHAFSRALYRMRDRIERFFNKFR